MVEEQQGRIRTVKSKVRPVITQADEYKRLLIEAQGFVAELAQGSRTPYEAAFAIGLLGPNYEKLSKRIAAGEVREPEAAELVAYWQDVYLPALQRVAQQPPSSVAPSCPF